MKYTKKEAATILTRCAHEYQNNLVDHRVLFLATDKHKKVHSLEVIFERRQFLHLTGVIPKSGIDASRFFSRCIDSALGLDDFSFAQGDASFLKLDVLPYVVKPNLSANMIANFDGVYSFLQTSKLIGSVTAAVGFIFIPHLGYVPNTLLKEDMRKISNIQYRIIATYRKDKDDERYSELVYKAKKVDWDRITYPEEYSYLSKSPQ